MSIGSIDNGIGYILRCGESKAVVYGANNANGVRTDFAALLAGKQSAEYSYVAVGRGLEADYEGVDATGKIVVVERGDSSFGEKQRIAAQHGAIACIIYNNAAGNIRAQITEEILIPTATTTQAEGAILVNGGGVVGFKADDIAYTMSYFSSMGALDDLSIGVDVLGVGGSIYSSVMARYMTVSELEKPYDYMSGTSMSSPNVSGVMVAILQHLNEEYPELTAAQMRILAQQLVMSTATILYDADDMPLTPRRQGAGLADLDAAISSTAALTVTGEEYAKMNLGSDKEKDGIYTLKFNLCNFGDDARSYNIKTITFTETAADGIIVEKAYKLNGTETITVKNGVLEGETLTVAADTTAEIKIIINIDQAGKAYMDETFENGIYVEGYVCFDALDEGGVDLSIPWIAFYGDWYALPIMDGNAYEEYQNSFMGLSTVKWVQTTYYMASGYINNLGTYFYNLKDGVEAPTLDETYFAISDKVGINRVYFGLLRNITSGSIYANDTLLGTVFADLTVPPLTRSYWYYGLGPTATYMTFADDVTSELLDIGNNQMFDFTISVTYADKVTETVTYPIFVDNEAPTLIDAQKRVQDGKTYIDLNVYDNHYLQAIMPFTINDNGDYVRLSAYSVPAYNFQRNANNQITIDVTEYEEYMINGRLALQLADYALNESMFVVNMDDELLQATSYVQDTVLHNVDNEIIDTDTTSYRDVTVNKHIKNALSDEFVIVDGVLIEYNGKGGDVVIPDEVVKIGSMVFAIDETIKTMRINEGCVEVSDSAFWRTYNMTEVYIPKTLEIIGNSNFSGCTALTKFNFENLCNIKTIGTSFFVGNPGFTEIVFPETAQPISLKEAFKVLPNLEKITFNCEFASLDAVVSICPDVKEVIFNKNINKIIGRVCTPCLKLEKVSFYGDIQQFGQDGSNLSIILSGGVPVLKEVYFYGDVGCIRGIAMSNCPVLDTVAFGGNIGPISNYTFGMSPCLRNGFTLLAGNDEYVQDENGLIWTKDYSRIIRPSDYQFKGTFVLPETVTTLEDNMFSHAYAATHSWATDCQIGNAGEFIGLASNAFTYLYTDERTEMTGIVLHSGITSFPIECFRDNINLTFEFPNVVDFGKMCMRNTGFTSLTFGDNVKTIGEQVFNYSRNLTEITFTNYTNVKFTKKDYMFAGLEKLEEMTVPDWMGGLVAGIFQDCTALKKVIVPFTTTTVPMNAFRNCVALTEIQGIEDATTTGVYAFSHCESMEYISLKKLKSVTARVFEYCYSLKEVPYGDEVTSISSNYAFTKCISLKEIYVPLKLTSVASIQSMFYACTGVEAFVVPEGHTTAAAVDGILYNKAITLMYSYPIAKKGTELVIPETVKTLSAKIFMDNPYLEKVTMNTVTFVGESAFEGSAVKEMIMPNVVSVDKSAFKNSQLAVMQADKLANIGYEAFRNSKLTDVVLSDNIIYVENLSFANCGELKTISISEKAAAFDFSSVFLCTYAVENINVDENNANFAMDNGLFMNKAKTLVYKCLSDEKEVVVTEGVKKICPEAFYGNTTIEKVVLPESLVAIGDRAFFGCTSLNTVVLKSEKAPMLECLDFEGHSMPYNQFVGWIDGELPELTVIHPNHITYWNYIWTTYFKNHMK
ncbi:MAG: leucine-rich repeat protein [Clostridia bacterium]|nr:leucine-rich repeat protein [Clostridia bacterium]